MDATREGTLGTDPNDPDSDNDGFSDGYEAETGFNPLDPASHPSSSFVLRGAAVATDARDTDGDGLTNVYEDEIGTDDSVGDTDNDGSPDGIELLNGTNPLDPSDGEISDSDGDGVSDSAEVSFGSNPFSRDGDNDRASDAAELLYGTDPANPDTNHDGVIDGFDTRRSYRFVNRLIHFE